MKKTIIIAGVTRSGLTMTTTMLEAGGLPVEGEFPYEQHEIGKIPWDDVKGKVVKVVDTHLQFPPDDGEYLVIICKRSLGCQLKSVSKFMAFMRIKPTPKSVLRITIPRDHFRIEQWAEQNNIPKLTVNFADTLKDPVKQAARMALFLGEEIDIKMAASAVMKRSHKCHPRMLEAELLQLHYDKKLNKEVEALEVKGSEPPCLDCGAMTTAEAHLMCKVGDDGMTACHGFKLWPGGSTNA